MFKGEFKNGIISIGKGIVNALIGLINGLISALNGIAYPIREQIVELSKWTGKNYTMEIVTIPKIPYLATGGIINYPNRGVGLGGMAIGGERGAEGVIPLTDSQAMATLGEAIGRYITINANITNTMNGRIISRQLQQIQGQTAFAGNL